jgi:hypothetical protein
MLNRHLTRRSILFPSLSTLLFLALMACTESDECAVIPGAPPACGQCGRTCPEYQQCQDGVCREGGCSEDHFECVSVCCPIDKACSRGQCVDGCAGDGRCGPGRACNKGKEEALCEPGCSIQDVFYDDGEVNQNNPCVVCDSVSPTGWSDVKCPEGRVCDLGICK